MVDLARKIREEGDREAWNRGRAALGLTATDAEWEAAPRAEDGPRAIPEQPGLPSSDHVGPSAGNIEQDFIAFHQANPQVYDELVALARRWRARHGERTVGMKMLWEVLRWNTLMRTDDPAQGPAAAFKLNNNYHSYYARLIQDREPDLAEAFHLRKLRR